MLNFLEAKKQFKFESFGVIISIECNSQRFLKKIVDNLQNVIPEGYFAETDAHAEHNFIIETDDKRYRLLKNGEVSGVGESEINFVNYFFSRLRLTIAEFAVGKVFIHAGVVGWKGKAIVIPGTSFSGKTTLVAELLRHGAVYYSDEYAVLDEAGNAHPFPKTLSVRGIIDDYKQVEFAAETFGGETASQVIPVGMIFLAQYEKDAVWNPQIISAGNGVLEILAHTIPIRLKPKYSLQVLNYVANRAIIAKSKRGDAQEVVNLLLKFFETEAI